MMRRWLEMTLWGILSVACY